MKPIEITHNGRTYYCRHERRGWSYIIPVISYKKTKTIFGFSFSYTKTVYVERSYRLVVEVSMYTPRQLTEWYKYVLIGVDDYINAWNKYESTGRAI
jgi:hypothetical protein